MLIGIDGSRANFNHKTGTEWYSYHLIKNLAVLDSKNEYIIYTHKPLECGLADLTREKRNVEDASFQPEFDKNGFQIIKSPHNNFKAKILRWPYVHFWTLIRLSLECLLHAPDILFVPSHVLPLIHPCKSIVTIHDIGFIKNKHLYKSEPIGPDGKWPRIIVNAIANIATFGKYSAKTRDYLNWSTEFALKHAKKIITVSNYSKEDILKSYRLKKDNIAVVYNGYDNNIYKVITDISSVDSVLDKYGITRPYFFYVGKIEKKKNIPNLIEAFALFCERNKGAKHKLVLVGDAHYGYDEAHYLIREYNLDDEVLMPGWIEERDMPFVYNGADAFIYPSYYEAFGITLLEAMASGVPVAASDIASIPEVLLGAGILFDPCDINSIAKGLEKIIFDSQLRNELITAGLKRSSSFSWKKCAEETLKIINSLV